MAPYLSLAAWALASLIPLASAAECPVSLPASSPVSVPGWANYAERGWYGSEALAVLIPADGRWTGMGEAHHWRDKFWIWRRGYDPKSETRPALTLLLERLDDLENPQRASIENATNAFGNGWSSMLTMLQFPNAGCWKVTAKYTYIDILHELTFVLSVGALNDSDRTAPSGSADSPAAVGYASPGASDPH